MKRGLLISSVALAMLHAASAAAADPPKGAAPAPAAPPETEEVGPDAGAKRAAAPDTRKGHLLFGVGATAMGPAGSMGPNTPSTQLAAAGFGVSGFLGVGLGRHVTFQAVADWTKFLAPGACGTGCGGRSYSIGLGLTYHLAQGIAFDPWASYGIAYRTSTFDVIDPSSPTNRVRQEYQGIDIARISLGGDFYPTPFLGFGPFLELDLGTNFRRPPLLVALPPDVSDTPRTYALFQIGFRIAFDPLRKSATPPAKQASQGALLGF